MNFAELRFWACLIAGLLLAAGVKALTGRAAFVRDGRFDRAFLLVLGLVLLGMVSMASFVIHLVVAVFTYGVVRWGAMLPVARGRGLLWWIVPLQLAPLFHYKYAGFVAHGILGIPGRAFLDLGIPAGISFYTFQLVGFAVDTLVHRRPVPGAFDFLNFAGFFPQIVAGPIERRDDLLPQITSFRLRWHAPDIDAGAAWIALGLFFKLCLADNLAELFRPEARSNAYLVWLANVVFGLRIYHDFAGYSMVAVGIARCLGVRLTPNFLSPYCAAGPAEFWRRWHVTLGRWFREYIYVPLGGGRGPAWAFNIAVVFLVSGVWHGAGWNFLLWGAFHAVLLIGARLAAGRVLPAPVGVAGMWFAAAFSWLLFYETDTAALAAKLRTLVTPAAYAPSMALAASGAYGAAELATLAAVLALCALTLALEALSLRRHDRAYACLLEPRVLVVLVVLTVLLTPGGSNDFIYFAF